MKMGIDLNGVATVEHLNIRRKSGKSEDDQVTAIDAKITMEHDCTALVRAVGMDDDHAFRFAIWDEAGDPRMLGVEEIRTWAEFSGCVVSLASRFKCYAIIRKIVFTPQADWRARITLTATIDAPQDEIVNLLVGAIKDDISFICQPAPELDLGPAA